MTRISPTSVQLPSFFQNSVPVQIEPAVSEEMTTEY